MFMKVDLPEPGSNLQCHSGERMHNVVTEDVVLREIGDTDQGVIGDR